MSSKKVGFLKGLDKIVVPTTKGHLFIAISDISYIKSENVNAIIITEASEIVVFSSLLSLERVLEGTFIRTHKSYLVNIDMICVYQKQDGGSITLTNGEIIPVSRQKRIPFLEGLGLR